MPKRRARVHQGIFQKKSLGLTTKGKYSLIWHLLCRVSKWDSVFSSTRTETGLAAVAWERWNLKLGNRKGQESYLGESLTERWRGGG